MGDSTYRKHLLQLSDSTSYPRPKRRKYESEERENLVQLLKQLEKNAKAAVLILDNYDLQGRFRSLRDEVKIIIPMVISSTIKVDSYSPPYLKYFSSRLAVATESDYRDFDGGAFLSAAICTRFQHRISISCTYPFRAGYRDNQRHF